MCSVSSVFHHSYCQELLSSLFCFCTRTHNGPVLRWVMIFLHRFSWPCSCCRFWVRIVIFFFFVHICSCKIAPCCAVWQWSGPVVWISLCNSLNRWTMYLQFGSSSHKINQAFVCFIYFFSVTDFISFPTLLNREAGTLNVNLKNAVKNNLKLHFKHCCVIQRAMFCFCKVKEEQISTYLKIVAVKMYNVEL